MYYATIYKFCNNIYFKTRLIDEDEEGDKEIDVL